MTPDERDHIRRLVERRMDFMVQSFFSSTLEMTGYEMGLYLLTLHYAWTNSARLPADEERLRRTLRFDKDEWGKAWAVVSKKWEKDGTWFKNRKLTSLYAAAWERTEIAVRKGKEGGKAKAALVNDNNTPARDPTVDPTRNPTVPAVAVPVPVRVLTSPLTPNGESISKEDPTRKRAGPFHPPTVEEVRTYAAEKVWTTEVFDPEYFVVSYGAKGWMIGKSRMVNWRLAAQKAWREGWTVKHGNGGIPTEDVFAVAARKRTDNERASAELTARRAKEGPRV